MKLSESKPLFFAALFVYFLSLTGVLLYFRFPAAQLKQFCELKLEQLIDGSDCGISGISYSFPLSVKAGTVHFSEKGQKENELFALNNVRISPDLSNLQSRFGINADGFGGTLSGTLDIDRAAGRFTIDAIRINDIDPSGVPFLKQASGRDISGVVAGDGKFHGVLKNGKYVTEGAGKVSLRDGSFALLLPILSLDVIDLKKFEMDLSFKNSILTCENGNFHGNEFDGEFAGTMALHSGLKRAALSFKGSLEPLPELLQKNKNAQAMVKQLQVQKKRGTVPFVLQGTVQKPSFKFES